ncbi:MAG: hypothetical protein U0P45_07855 [Acidimicrobiales bacterium]
MFDGDGDGWQPTTVALDFTGPPRILAWATLATGALAVAIGLAVPDAGLAAYVIGACAVLTGIAFRAIVKRRQGHPMYLPNYVTTRVMLFGVLAGFIGLFFGALHLATRTMS